MTSEGPDPHPCWNRRIPVDIEDLARSAGVAVSFASAIPEAPSATSVAEVGPADVGPEGPRVRVVTANTPMGTRFRLAHAFAYHDQGRVEESAPVYAYPASYSASAQGWARQANERALTLLAPSLALRYLLVEQSLQDLREIADRLDLSEVAVQQRLRQAGWL